MIEVLQVYAYIDIFPVDQELKKWSSMEVTQVIYYVKSREG